MTLDPDSLHRTLKLEMDYGDAASPEDAERIVHEYVLQILVGPNVATSPTRQATLLTAVNSGSRAFLGGVHIKMFGDFELMTPWDSGRPVSEVLAEFDNVTFVNDFDAARPVIVIGDNVWTGELPLYPTWHGWAAGVVPNPDGRLAEGAEFALAGVLSGALAVSEAFQWTRGYKVAAGRPVGLSLWTPGADWTSPDAAGVELARLPNSFWLLGLGHLGQAYAWALGFLPFPVDKRQQVRVMLQDVEEVVDANEATSLLVRRGERGLKTRVVEQQLKQLGFRVRATDRLFDEHTHRNDNRHPEPPEPRLALAGFDENAPRRLLEGAGFSYIVDAGLGVGRFEYLSIALHTFPSSRAATDIFPNAPRQPVDEARLDRDAYRTAANQLVQSGAAATVDLAKCGLIDVAGKAAGAAFVGTVAAALALSELLRLGNGGLQYETVNLNLRTPEECSSYYNPDQKRVTNPGFVNI